MTNRWEEINRLYSAAVEVEENERASFLEKSCGGDEELRREVESLLAYDQKAQQLLDRPAMQIAAEKLASEPPSLVGRKLGPYQIQLVLGAGGMGEVYKAKDTRLNRTVAIKVLPRLLSERADLRQRFEREARAVASLNHSNICALYDIGSQDGIDFLVMEYLEGKTLSKRLKKGPLPTEQLLRCAIEIATALDQAHRHGVTHRDLKPGNIMLTKQGAKLLDFGLAKQTGGAGALRTLTSARGSTPSTQSDSLTEEGTLLGTLEYMAPEQVEGKEADTRTDIFAIGVVMYEMATSRKAFQGDSNASLAAAILTAEPPAMTKLEPLTPPALERVVRKCLEKDPEERWQSARDLLSELKWIAEGGEAAGIKPVASRGKYWQFAWMLVAAFLIAALIGVISYPRLTRAPARAIISEILPPETTQFQFADWWGAGPPALSPDGRSLAFTAMDESGKRMIWVRSLHSPVAHGLAGTEQGERPFWSPDGRKLGFFADGKLQTIDIAGGPATILADAPGNGGGSWNREGVILFLPDRTLGLYRMGASGGTPARIAIPNSSESRYYAWPRFLPDGKHFLYNAAPADPAQTGIHLASLDGKENRLLLAGRSNAIYADGYLLYYRDGTLMAQAFDLQQRQLKGDAQPVADRVSPLSSNFGGGVFDVSDNGMLIYQQGTGERRISWVDRSGKELNPNEVSEEGTYFAMRFSQDGVRLGLNTREGIWVEDASRNIRMRLTRGGGYGTLVWSPDGSQILFSKFVFGLGQTRLGIYQMNSDGTGGEQLVLAQELSDPNVWPTSWSLDGRFLLFVRGSIGNPMQRVWVLPLAGDRRPRLFLPNAYDGQFSPDGRWVAYTSHESGNAEIYVVPFDAATVLSTDPDRLISPAGKWPISPKGGAIARWRGDGKEIFYRDPAPGNRMWAAEVDGSGKGFKARKAQVLFQVAAWADTQFDVSPDSKRFVVITKKPLKSNPPLTLVVNWAALLTHNP